MEKPSLWAKIKRFIKKLLQFALNPRFLLCFGIAWMITNGWAYILLGIGAFFKINWMSAVGGSYLAFLWLPISPEKLITFPIAIYLMRLIFPKDEKTLGLLKDLFVKAKAELRRKKCKKCKKSARVCKNNKATDKKCDPVCENCSANEVTAQTNDTDNTTEGVAAEENEAA